MGNCISAPKKLVDIISKKYHYNCKSKPKTNSKHARFGHEGGWRSVNLRTRVLKDSSGSNIFERYKIGEEFGRGEFGVTSKCFDLKTGEAFACKKISKARLRAEIDIEDVRREVEIMKHLPKHPNIVAFREAFEDKEFVYLVMELCHGVNFLIESSLKVIIRNEPPLELLKPFLEIIKMAPEVLRRNYGKEVDIWSAGVILYILLCGIPPFWADCEEGIARAIIREKIDFQRDPWPKVSSEAKDPVRRMLDQNRISVQQAFSLTSMDPKLGKCSKCESWGTRENKD
ncbi:Detected protein of unknown function [Hibiscus syriacus]|uniref:non-specific serine/threonine protein kinase n=1 Tax=Hibiscus syriacus TaxID=106335 RepID=A0A6A3CY23_HIBSY|nr:Detected protein of unknown function [Hibiscus syriacus]